MEITTWLAILVAVMAGNLGINPITMMRLGRALAIIDLHEKRLDNLEGGYGDKAHEGNSGGERIAVA